MCFRELQANIFSKGVLELAVDLMKRNIECRHDPGFMLGFWDYIVFAVVKFQVNDLIYYVCIMASKIIKGIKISSVVLKLEVPYFWGYEVRIACFFVFLGTKFPSIYINFTCGTISGAYFYEISSLGGSFWSIGCKKYSSSSSFRAELFGSLDI